MSEKIKKKRNRRKCDVCYDGTLHITLFVQPRLPYTGYRCDNPCCRYPIGSNHHAVIGKK